MEFIESLTNEWGFIVSILPQMMKGLLVSVQVFAVTIIFAIPLGLIISLGRISKIKPIKWLTGIYIWLFRGTPLLLQLFFFYYGLGIATPIKMTSFVAACVTFVLNYSAYFAEIFRAGIGSIDEGQYEASKALGFNYAPTMRFVVIPQMIRNVLPPITNETITLVKDTALVSAISLFDLLQASKSIVSRTANLTPYVVAAVFYLILTLIFTYIFKLLENRFAIGQSR